MRKYRIKFDSEIRLATEFVWVLIGLRAFLYAWTMHGDVDIVVWSSAGGFIFGSGMYGVLHQIAKATIIQGVELVE